MRALEARLTSEPRAVVLLAADIFGDSPNWSQIESTRRAAHRLGELGRAEVRCRGLSLVEEWGPDYDFRSFLTIRTPLSPEEVAAQARRLSDQTGCRRLRAYLNGGDCPRKCVGMNERDRHVYENEERTEQQCPVGGGHPGAGSGRG
jgi:hypothetical protein